MNSNGRQYKYFSVAVEDGKELYTYKKFRWFIEWLEYSETLPKDIQPVFSRAISTYGLFAIEPTDLQGDALNYFNEKIRPELNRQHKRLREGKKL